MGVRHPHLPGDAGPGGRSTGVDDDFAVRGFDNLGAWILGRNMFGPVRGPWPDEDWKGWWGDTPPYHCPVFVLTHHDRPALEMKGGTVFHFVTGGIHEALDRAQGGRRRQGHPGRRRRFDDPPVSRGPPARRAASRDRAGPAGQRRAPVRRAGPAGAGLRRAGDRGHGGGDLRHTEQDRRSLVIPAKAGTQEHRSCRTGDDLGAYHPTTRVQGSRLSPG